MVDGVLEAAKMAVLSNSSIPDAVLNASINSLESLSERYYNLGKSSFDGLPKVNKNFAKNQDALNDILEYIANSNGVQPNDVVFLEEEFGSPIDNDFYIYHEISLQYEVNYKENYIIFNGKKNFIDRIMIERDIFTIYISEGDGYPEFRIKLDYIEPDMNLLGIKYKIISSDFIGHFLYKYKSGNPSVDKYMDETGEGDFYPFSPIRQNKESLHINEDDDKWKSRSGLLRSIGIDPVDISKTIYENPDVEKIDDAIFTLALNVYEDGDEAACYFYNYFKGSGFVPYTGQVVSNSIKYYDENSNEDKIKTIESPKKFYTKLSPKELGLNEFNIVIIHEGVDITQVTGVFPYPDREFHSRFEDDDFILESKLSDNSYELVRVKTLEIDSWDSEHGSFDEPNTSRVGAYGNKKKESQSLSGSNFCIPLERKAMRDVKKKYRRIIIYKSMQVMVYSYFEYTVKWYQSGFFKVLVSFVGIALSIWTGGYSNVVAAFAVSITTGILVTSTIILTALLVREIVKIIAVKAGDSFLGILFAIIATAAISYYSGGTSVDLFSLPSAESLLMSATKAVEIYNNVLVEGLDSQKMDWELKLNKSKEALDKLRDELDGNAHPEYFNALQDGYDRYFDNAIHDKNSGVKSLESIREYYRLIFTLPKDGVNIISEQFAFNDRNLRG